MAKATKTDRLAKARARIRDAETAYYDLVKTLFPIGCSVEWSMGGHRQYGRVELHSRGRLFVENARTLKRYWIDTYFLRDDE